jgi:hypothetical protein
MNWNQDPASPFSAQATPPRTLAETFAEGHTYLEDPMRLARERVRARARDIEREANALIEKEQYDAEVERRANEIRAKYSRSLWQRLIDKLPFTIQRRTET